MDDITSRKFCRYAQAQRAACRYQWTGAVKPLLASLLQGKRRHNAIQRNERRSGRSSALSKRIFSLHLNIGYFTPDLPPLFGCAGGSLDIFQAKHSLSKGRKLKEEGGEASKSMRMQPKDLESNTILLFGGEEWETPPRAEFYGSSSGRRGDRAFISF